MTNLSSTKRIGWIEALKGITICLVVIHHVTFSTQFWLWSEHGASLPEYILIANQFLSNCRMPAFFFCSGLVFSMNIRRGRSWVINKRILGAAWIIIVWTFLSYLFEMTGLDLVPWNSEQARFIHAVWSPFGVLWFMYAIMICTITSYLLRNFDAQNQILISLILTVLAAYLRNLFEITEGLQELLGGLAASGFFFFIAGSALGSNAIQIIEDERSSLLLVLFSVFLLFFFYKMESENLVLDLFCVRIPSTIVLICTIRFLVDRSELLSEFFSLLGSRSLNIFVTHQFVIAVALALWIEHVNEAYPRSMWLVLGLFTAGGTFIASRYVHRLTGGLAYEPPKWLSFARIGN